MKRQGTGRVPASRLGLLALAAALVAGCSTATTGGQAVTASPGGSETRLTVTSTLDGHTSLPHRIHWQAFPSGPSFDVSEVDFLIDGKQLWVEHHAPYFYGDDGNYLVTSFLTPGRHVFTVRAIDSEGETATDSVTASVPLAPSPPAALTGTWKRIIRQMSGPSSCAPGPCPPAGYWRLVISPIGWQVYDTAGGGSLVDVAYLSPGLVELRTGMATGHDMVAGAPTDEDLNGWCNNAPGSPARYRWSVTGTHLRFTFAGGHPCPGFTQFLTAAWTRVS